MKPNVRDQWLECDISDLCKLQRGFDLTEATRKQGNVPVYSSSGLSYFHNEARLQPPAVITGRKGLLGKVFFVEEPCWPHDTTLWVKDFNGNDPRFVSIFLGQFHLERFDAATSVPTLNRNNLVGIPICVPPLREQRVIAEVLSDMDALLGALDRLIAKKRDLKQAAMQQLLTGQTRLPGFSGEWEVKRLGDVVEKLVGGGTPSRANPDYWGNEIPWVTVKDFATFNPRQTQESITRFGLTNSASHLIQAGTLITSTRMALGKAVIYEVDVAINQDLKALVIKPTTRVPFLYYWFEHNAQIISTLGSGSTVKGISIGALKGLQFPNLSLREQTAIATVLSDMDAELEALEQRRAKTAALKQGMMQELLTGRTRLV